MMIIIVAIVVSIILYLSGVYSGLYANKILEKKTSKDIQSLKIETKNDLTDIKIGTEEQVKSLENYITVLENNLNNAQLEQIFIESLSEKEQCNFSEITMNYLFEDLRYYWRLFPFRLEEYEKYNKLTDEYIILKNQYTALTIRTWILSKNIHNKCDPNLIYGLHFYSANCTNCIEQAEQIDLFLKNVTEDGREVIMFPVDYYSNERIVQFIKDYYKVDSVPTVIINEKVFRNRVYSSKELIKEANPVKELIDPINSSTSNISQNNLTNELSDQNKLTIELLD